MTSPVWALEGQQLIMCSLCIFAPKLCFVPHKVNVIEYGCGETHSTQNPFQMQKYLLRSWWWWCEFSAVMAQVRALL